MQIFLELSGHPKANIKRIRLTGNTVVGRSKKCGLQIASPGVSRKHCEIRLGDETALVVDLGSSNGTFVASERIPAGEEHPLPEGTRLNIGGIRFLVSYTAPAAKSAEPAESDEAAAAVSQADRPAEADEALPVDDEDNLLGLGDEKAAEPVAVEASGDQSADEDEASLAADESMDSPPVGATREADPSELMAEDKNDEETNEEPILGGGSAILSDEDDILPVDEATDSAVADASSAPSPGAESRKEVNNFEQSEDPKQETSASGDDSPLGDVEDDEPILVFDDQDDETATAETSESDVDLSDSTTYYGDTEREESAGDAEEVDANASENEPILDADDEDEAFSFLSDDDNGSEKSSKSNTNDSELGDFLSRLGRD